MYTSSLSMLLIRLVSKYFRRSLRVSIWFNLNDIKQTPFRLLEGAGDLSILAYLRICVDGSARFYYVYQ